MNLSIGRRQFLQAGAAVAASSILTSPKGAFAQDKRLRLTWWGTQIRADRTNAAAALFAKEKGSLTLNSEFLPWGDYWPKLATQTAGGNSPDIFQMDLTYFAEYAGRGAILPLQGFQSGKLDLSSFDAESIKAGTVGGNLVGVSLGLNASAMIVNTVAFEEAGVAPLTQAYTWDDLARIAVEISNKSPRKKIYGVMDGSGTEYLLENWLRQQGLALYTADGKLAFDASHMRQWFKMWADIRAAGGCPPPDVQALNQALDATSSMITLGYSAIAFDQSNLLAAYQAVNKDKLTLHNFPRVGAGGKGGHYRKNAMFFSVSSKAKDPELCAEFLSFFVNSPDAAKALQMDRGVPASTKLQKELAASVDGIGKIALEYVANLGDLAGPLPPMPARGAGEVIVALQRASQAVAFGQSTPEKGADDFVAEATTIVSRT